MRAANHPGHLPTTAQLDPAGWSRVSGIPPWWCLCSPVPPPPLHPQTASAPQTRRTACPYRSERCAPPGEDLHLRAGPPAGEVGNALPVGSRRVISAPAGSSTRWHTKHSAGGPVEEHRLPAEHAGAPPAWDPVSSQREVQRKTLALARMKSSKLVAGRLSTSATAPVVGTFPRPRNIFTRSIMASA